MQALPGIDIPENYEYEYIRISYHFVSTHGKKMQLKKQIKSRKTRYRRGRLQMPFSTGKVQYNPPGSPVPEEYNDSRSPMLSKGHEL